MRLLRLYLKKAGVFDQNVIHFTNSQDEPQSVICLSGVNGSGKTTILEVIAQLMDLLHPYGPWASMTKTKPSILTRVEFAQLDLLYEGRLLSIVAGDQELIQRDAKYEQTFVIEHEIKAFVQKIEPYSKMNKEEIDREQVKAMVEQFVQRKLTKLNAAAFQPLLDQIQASYDKEIDSSLWDRLPFVVLFRTNSRIIGDISYSSIPKYEPLYLPVHIYDHRKDDLNGALVYLDYAYPELYARLRDWLNKQVLTGKTIDRIDRPKFKVMLRTKKGHEHGLDALSSGEESLLVMAMQLYVRAKRHAVFLIDEIDQSLHPEYQRRMMRIVKEVQAITDCQIIVTSHSRFIWDQLESDEARIRLTEVLK